MLATPSSGGAALWHGAQPVSEMGVPPRTPQGRVEPSAMAGSETSPFLRLTLASGSEAADLLFTDSATIAWGAPSFDGDAMRPWSL